MLCIPPVSLLVVTVLVTSVPLWPSSVTMPTLNTYAVEGVRGEKMTVVLSVVFQPCSRKLVNTPLGEIHSTTPEQDTFEDEVSNVYENPVSPLGVDSIVSEA